ncbi:hypothetical protein A3K34_00085 [candidate division WWE3 bacterium RIFOXYC1_FULL_40_10]|uniref:Septum formation initiator n=1 Tax=candidate division WWE3 bacterium RIFOXYA2_FULL_46_9 TaxID=1802636 RepID=A0A1F4W1B3_UNCKA|nr:MAG: hypothetical protein A3K58_00085 [candidate division WWE3 bacterium RIFOXYB1_FULL_40_22]OGC61294.1 MAG: hypothetical protein A3K37_00085 [candidate division WWE3 bacterium RIFOXYA1_FULL_40_11]OGC63204.1 MAG: hypothetical protein A2264_00740 [candidate division WWE3 bacterium RIFOXYA2_FULL_46_9]OGC65285.1 MAG: hypothetical protein A2326_04370 [candidate division WWE3 bacterium RIFOXYB2_FULL_41_6]OGC65677.1 MAG: hypothetical protein A3K34_00085 [candidate division WWE3 bacterium RIFOXYC1_
MPLAKKIKLITITVLLSLVTIGLVKNSFMLLQSKKRLDDIRAEVTKLNNKKSELEAEIAYKQTPEYIEEKARNDLNMIKPGEKVYVYTGYSDDQVFSSNQEEYRSFAIKGVHGDVAGSSAGRDAPLYMWYRLFFSF